MKKIFLISFIFSAVAFSQTLIPKLPQITASSFLLIDAETNKIDNGLLLRADLHNLFDLYLISINPKDFTILVSREIKDSDYRKLHGKKIKMPKNEIKSPSKKALDIHLKNFKG